MDGEEALEESPFERGTPERRYGMREIPMDADASNFVVWNIFNGSIGYVAIQFQFSPHFIVFIRRIIDDLRILVSIPVRMLLLVWKWLVFLWGIFTITYDVNIPILSITIPVPLPVWIMIYMLFFYLINAFWPLVLVITVTVAKLLVVPLAFSLLIVNLLSLFKSQFTLF